LAFLAATFGFAAAFLVVFLATFFAAFLAGFLDIPISVSVREPGN
jgi:hypothetical protein